MSFGLVDHTKAQDPTALARRTAPPSFRSLEDSAPNYRPSPELAAAVNVALSLAAPLLITGEPGTGKTQVAHYLRHYFGLPTDALFTLDVTSSTTADDLTARFDHVRYFHAASDPERPQDEDGKRRPLARSEFVNYGPLYHAYKAGRAVVLIDEIDKAQKDFPNDLLGVLDQNRFTIRETGEAVQSPQIPPVIVITSNSERRLPEPFLRRCVFHHIKLTPKLIDEAVKAHVGAYSDLSAELVKVAISRFQELRAPSLALRKMPGTAELLAWLATLQASGHRDAELLGRTKRAELPYLSTLIKDSEDLGRL